MIGPILEAEGLEWSPELAARLVSSHFAARAAERGVRSVCGGILAAMIKAALAQGREDVLERVFRICPESELYRIILPEGLFYPVIKSGVAVTIYNARQKRLVCGSRKRNKKTVGRRARRWVQS